MKSKILIFDNFYPSPDEIQNRAMQSPSISPKNNDGFNGELAKIGPSFAKQIMKKISNLMQTSLSYKISEQGHFKFLNKSQQSNKQTHIHIDFCEWSGVLCLSSPKFLKGYTSFWRHKKMGLDGLYDATDINRVSSEKGLSFDDMLSLMERDTGDQSKWVETGRIHHAYNRLILFRGNMFHQASEGFGSSKKTSKITQTFFFQEWNRKEPGKKSSDQGYCIYRR